MAKTITRTFKSTVASVSGYNRITKEMETRTRRLFDFSGEEFDILIAFDTPQFRACEIVSCKVEEELREMDIEEFYAKSRPVVRKGKEEKEQEENG